MIGNTTHDPEVSPVEQTTNVSWYDTCPICKRYVRTSRHHIGLCKEVCRIKELEKDAIKKADTINKRK